MSLPRGRRSSEQNVGSETIPRNRRREAVSPLGGRGRLRRRPCDAVIAAVIDFGRPWRLPALSALQTRRPSGTPFDFGAHCLRFSARSACCPRFLYSKFAGNREFSIPPVRIGAESLEHGKFIDQREAPIAGNYYGRL